MGDQVMYLVALCFVLCAMGRHRVCVTRAVVERVLGQGAQVRRIVWVTCEFVHGQGA
jgi:hypothetical protein